MDNNRMDNMVKMIIGNKTVDMPVAASQFHKLTTTGQFVLQTSDGEDLVASCVSFVASGADYEPIKKHVKLNKTWQQLEIGDDPLVVFFRNVTVVGVGDVLDHGVEAVTQGQKVPFLIPVEQWQIFHMQPGSELSVRSKSTSRILLMVMPR